MLHSIDIKNFTVFGDHFPLLKFSPGLNIIIGENATGKSHLMKLGYSLAYSSVQMADPQRQRHSKDEMGRVVGDKLIRVFGTDKLGRLVSRKQGRNHCDVTIDLGQNLGQKPCGFSFSFSTNSRTAQIIQMPPHYLNKKPVYFPTREMLSPYPGFAAACREQKLCFDDTYVDLADALSHSQTLGRREKEARTLMEPLEDAMQAKVFQKDNRFYFRHRGKNKGVSEVEFEAEGHRKMAMLAFLIANGQLDQAGSTLFWDEPETNMNARMLRVIAKAVNALSDKGVQIIIATHSLFLLRELNMLNMDKNNNRESMKVIALARNDAGEVIVDTCENDIDDINPDYFVTLSEEAAQAGEYIDMQRKAEAGGK